MSDGGTYQIEDARLLHDGHGKDAILINSEETGNIWIPKIQLVDMDMEDAGDEGCVEVTAWLARKLGLED